MKPPPMPPRPSGARPLDDELRSYLEQLRDHDRVARETREDERDQRIAASLGAVATETKLLTQAVDHLDEKVSREIKGLDARIAKLESSVEDTGRHNLEEIRRAAEREEKRLRVELDKHLDDRKWLVRLVLGLLITGAIMYFIGRATASLAPASHSRNTTEDDHERRDNRAARQPQISHDDRGPDRRDGRLRADAALARRAYADGVRRFHEWPSRRLEPCDRPRRRGVEGIADRGRDHGQRQRRGYRRGRAWLGVSA